MHSQQPLHIIHITDSHLGKQAGDHYRGIDADASLQRVVALIEQQQSNPDVLIVTGDIAANSDIDAYRRFYQTTRHIAKHYCWLPGNHDDPTTMQCVTADNHDIIDHRLSLGDWQIVMLDSSVVGKVSGHLAQQQLERLEQTLADNVNQHTIVCLHHHPIAMGCAWMDQLGLNNSDALFALLDRYTTVRVVLWGHVHQPIDQQRAGVRLLSTPSTSVQFAPHSATFATDKQAPGYRHLQLFVDGRVITTVHRTQRTEDGGWKTEKTSHV